jgi:hypothetical protein
MRFFNKYIESNSNSKDFIDTALYEMESVESVALQRKIKSLIPKMLPKVQKVYDNWDQDEEGYAEGYGHGGICDDIAEAICDVLYTARIDCVSVYNESFYHTSPYAYDFSDFNIEEYEEQGDNRILIKVDIPPYVYEEGAGYIWKKIPNVKFTARDFVIEDMSWNVSDMFDLDGNLIEY